MIILKTLYHLYYYTGSKADANLSVYILTMKPLLLGFIRLLYLMTGNLALVSFLLLKQARRLCYSLNVPCSIYQYSNIAPRILVVLSLYPSLLGIEGQKKVNKFVILSRKPSRPLWNIGYPIPEKLC